MFELLCDYCKKLVGGHTLSEARHLLGVHKISKHKDIVEITEIKKKVN